MKKLHNVGKLTFKGDKMILFVDGKQYEFQLSKISQRLANATLIEKENFEISPSGYGIHWPLLDEDLSVDGLVGIKHSLTKLKEKAVF